MGYRSIDMVLTTIISTYTLKIKLSSQIHITEAMLAPLKLGSVTGLTWPDRNKKFLTNPYNLNNVDPL